MSNKKEKQIGKEKEKNESNEEREKWQRKKEKKPIQQKEIWKTNKVYEENTKEEKRERERDKKKKWIWKVVEMEDTTLEKKKVVFVLKRNKQTNGMKKRKVLWWEKENDERERGPEIKGQNWDKDYFSKKGSKQKDQNKEAKKLGKDTHLKRRRFWKDDVYKHLCKEQQEN